MASKLKIIPLGGVTEIGKNTTVIEYGKDMVIIDCGSIFPTEDMPGIDLVIPDFTYVEKNIDKLRALLITHGHEDHIGAIPYFLKKINRPIPIYGSKLTLALIKHKLDEHGITDAILICVESGEKIRFGCFQAEFIRVCHSIAGSFAISLNTPMGTVIHTGDFKIDYTPIDGEPMDLARFATLGKKGVLCLLCDSTNSESEGSTLSEKMVGETFERYFNQATGRVIVASFASNIHRIQQIIDTAVSHGRKVCFQGRSMINISNLARELGYMKVEDTNIVDVERLKNYDEDKICVITTGSQGEPMSGLARMANSSHKLNVGKGDMVIISASAIPGNEKSISKVINNLFRKGVHVVYESMADVHVSGHAKKEELKLIHSLLRPKYFVPIHGEYRHLIHHTMIAQDMGMDPETIIVADLGNVVELTRSSAALAGSVQHGSVMIDGLGVGDIGNIVLRDRRLLSEDGLFVVVVTLSKREGKLLAGPDIISRGFVYVRESEELIREAKKIARQIALEFESKPYSDWSGLKINLKNELHNFLYNQTKRNPVILPIIVEA